MKRAALLSVGLAAFWALLAWAAMPKLINFQGILKDGSGNPVANGPYFVTFRIYDAPSGGTVLWSDTQTVSTNAGLFNAVLGKGTSVPDSVFKDTVRYLGITVFPDAEMSPRQRLISVPYSYVAGSGASSGWNLTGNSGTVPGTNFLGTTDKQSLELKVNGARAFRLEPNDSSPNLIGGHSSNFATPGVLGATIGGGGANLPGSTRPNIVTDWFGTVGGGGGNRAGDSAGTTDDQPYATVGGGVNNAASAAVATIGGGSSDTASGIQSTVSGGSSNTASGLRASVGGGRSNSARNDYATVGGGLGDTATGRYATVNGGRNNIAAGDSSTVSGGAHNAATGVGSTVPGGFGNAANGAGSFAVGQRAKALQNGTFVWADGTPADFASTGANQFLIRAQNVGIGLNNPSKKLDVAGSIKGDTVFSNVLSSNSPLSIQAPAGTTRMFINDANGKVGIGTSVPGSRLQVSGAIATAVTTVVAASTTLDDSHSVVLCDTFNGVASDIYLPSAVGISGRQYTIKNLYGFNNITIHPFGSELIDFGLTYVLAGLNKYVSIVSDGSNWFVVANN